MGGGPACARGLSQVGRREGGHWTWTEESTAAYEVCIAVEFGPAPICMYVLKYVCTSHGKYYNSLPLLWYAG